MLVLIGLCYLVPFTVLRDVDTGESWLVASDALHLGRWWWSIIGGCRCTRVGDVRGLALGFLFVPMAKAVIFALVCSFILSRTLVPTMAKYLLKPHAYAEGGHGAERAPSRNPLPTTMRSTSRGCAPSARRTPISRVRCVTRYASTP